MLLSAEKSGRLSLVKRGRELAVSKFSTFNASVNGIQMGMDQKYVL